MEFRDVLALRYRKPLLNGLAFCDGCGAPFDLSHALSCKKGGLIIQRHNEIRDAVGDLADTVWTQVQREPIVRQANDSESIPALIADLGVRGVWEPQTLALFDIRVIDTDAPSHLLRAPESILASAETKKKKKYQTACAERRATFTPFVTSCDGALGLEAKCFIKHLAQRLSGKWERQYTKVVGWIRTRLAFAILRTTNQCIHGARIKRRSLGMEDGAPIRMVLN